METVALLVVLGLTAAVALAAARGVLSALLYVMAHGRPPATVPWHPLVAAGVLFWFWYFMPVVAAPVAVARVLDLLSR